MAKVRLLKNHNGQKKGTVGDVKDARAEYLVRVKVAEYVDEKPKAEPKKAVATEAKEVETTAKKSTKKVEAPKAEPCKSC